jgi:phosphoketolase
MIVQHAKWLQLAATEPGRSPVPSLNVLLTSTTWRNDHNGFSHQGPGLIDTVAPLSPDVTRIWFPPDANSTLVVADECLRSRGRLNLIVVDEQRHLQYLDLEGARTLVSAGGAVWEWAGTEEPDRSRTDLPDVVLAAAGDVPTMETSVRRSCSASTCRTCVSGWSTWSTSWACSHPATTRSPSPRNAPPTCSPTPSTWSSPSTATRGRSTR